MYPHLHYDVAQRDPNACVRLNVWKDAKIHTTNYGIHIAGCMDPDLRRRLDVPPPSIELPESEL
jgi:hypothetical protein